MNMDSSREDAPTSGQQSRGRSYVRTAVARTLLRQDSRMLDEISNVPPDGEASGPEAAGETPLCSDQETARSGSSNQAHMQLCNTFFRSQLCRITKN
jgi:hypothetical protein